MSPTIMAEKLGRNKATIYRELKRGRTDELDKNLNYEYDALLAHQRYQESFVCRGRKKVECGSIKIISHAHVKNGQLVEESHDDP
ncbi:hypothetical protein FACS1894202_08350 [Clostridia bacterium]|nr:hypothetical protein FACS1894202_08350 [Clostridia bacterium]